MKHEIDLIDKVLDTQIEDRQGRKIGRVDGMTIELRSNKPPRLANIEVGGPVPWERLSRQLGNWVARRGAEPYLIPWSKVQDVGITVQVDCDAEDAPSLKVERWLRDHIIGRIPGANA